MLRRQLGWGLLTTVVIATLVGTSVVPALATFSVEERRSTTYVTQTDAGTLSVIRGFDGNLVVSDGYLLAYYGPSENLVVRGSDATTPSFVEVVLASALPGSLTLDLPGASDVTVKGGVATIGGSLTVKGSAAGQIVRLGASGVPVTVQGSAKLDLRDGDDSVFCEEGTKILGSLVAKGVNHLKTGTLEVAGSFTANVKRESRGIEYLFVGPLLVGKSLTVVSGRGADYFRAYRGGAVGRNATIDFGDGIDGDQTLDFQFAVGGSFTARLAKSGFNDLLLSGSAKSVNVTALGDENRTFFYGPGDATSLKYTGGEGTDEVWLLMSTPVRAATLKLGGGSDKLVTDSRLQLQRLYVDFGEGTDTLDDHGGTPADTTFLNLP